MRNKLNLFLSSVFLTCCIAKAQDVNPFTGSLNYGVPLMTVPSDRGNNIPVSASYNAGIATKQAAGELGLGWNLNAGGAIYRSVSGIPDDAKPTVYDAATKSFIAGCGTLYFQDGYTGSKLDIYNSTYTFDSLDFEHPDYDFYNVSGPGIGGSMTPRIFHFGEISYDPSATYSYTVNPDSWTSIYKKPRFYMNGDFADTLISRHYPTAPIDGSTTFKKPEDVISGGYGNIFPFLGKTTKTSLASENYDTTTKRLGAQNYIEYFTNAEIATGTIVTHFINFESGHARSSTNYPQDGIGGFRVTTPDGMVYHYSQPAYTNYTVNYNYPLKNDYTMQDDYSINNSGTASSSNYVITHTLYSNSYAIEYRENLKYAYAWLLTAITGPDYYDANSNGMADAGDDGYWVNFDYKLWTKDFSTRSPAFGYDYSFQPDESNSTANLQYDNYALGKYTGKMASATISNREIYYLNSIKTNSHTALFIRDYRNDEHSTPAGMDKSPFVRLNVNDAGTVDSWSGLMYDDGGPSGPFTHNNYGKAVTVTNSEKITIAFQSLSMDATSSVKIYNGPNNTYTLIGSYTGTVTPSPVTVTTNTTGIIYFEQNAGASWSGNGFAIKWYATGRAKVVPQLEVSKVILVANDKMASLPSLSALSGSNAAWDLTSTTYSTSPIMYNNNWYSGSNKTTIDANSLQTVELTQDYTLAKKYHSNVNTTADLADRLTSPPVTQGKIAVVSGQMANSGKLTLKEITTYEINHTKMSPSVVFDYNDANTTDNPAYDPRKTDYWGYYKSDISDSAYSGYTTTVSKDSTDAWSLRKVTSPLGGTVEIAYESNSYDQVWKEKGGTQGPNRIYHIKTAAQHSGSTHGSDWDIATEESVSDLSDLIANTPATPVKFAFIPSSDGTSLRFQSFGASTIATQTVTPIRVSSIPTVYASTVSVAGWADDPGPGNTAFSTDATPPVYTGNGYLQFTLPSGTTVYGGGPRVSTITSRNGTNGEAYVTSYSYTGGVATAEADRFSIAKLYRVPGCTLKTYNPLRAYAYDKHKQNPAIGYTTVTVSNKGIVNTAQGGTTFTYITTDNGADNYLMRLQKRSLVDYNRSCPSGCQGTPSDSSMIIEVINKAGAYFGMMTNKKITDVNDNIISAEKYEYANTDQGSIVELFDLERLSSVVPSGTCVGCYTKFHRIYILRNYPVVNTKQTIYTRGTSSYVETLLRDEVTGQATLTRSVAPNASITVSKIVPAFRISDYAAMGPKCVDPDNTNQLSSIGTKKVTVDSTLTSSSDFLSHEVSTFTTGVKQRYWNSGSSKWDNQTATLPYWIGNSNYNWTGQAGSLDDYGLFKQSELSSNAFNFGTPSSSSSSYWRFGNEISLIDVNGHMLETRLYNNRFAAKKFGYTGYKYLVSQISNCNYRSFGYTGFEEYQTQGGNNYSQEILVSGSMVTSATSGSVTVNPKTGNYLVSKTNGTAAIYKVTYDGTGSNSEELGLLRNRYYRASVWVNTYSGGTPAITARLDGTWGGTAHTTTVTANISTCSTAITIGDWKLISVDIFVPADYTSTGGSYNDLEVWVECTGSGNTGYFDDFMLHPVEAAMSAKVFDTATGRVTADISNDNYATYYTYDEAGRVTEVWQDIPGSGKKKVKTVSYNFGRGL